MSELTTEHRPANHRHFSQKPRREILSSNITTTPTQETHSPLALWKRAARKLPAGHTHPKSRLRFSNLNCFSVFDQLNVASQKLKVFLREKGVDRDYALGPYRRGKLSSGKMGKLVLGLKLALVV